jgi:preprotein translocase subunit YajC
LSPLIILGALFALMWVLLIRPQRKRQADQQKLLSSVEPGDEVLTVGGLYGIVHELDEEDDLIVEIAEGIRVRIARRAVAAIVKPDDEDDVVDGEAIDEGDDATDDEDSVTAHEDSVTATDADNPTNDDRR